MLTRIEIDGFKSFSRFELSLSPFVVILGPNAVGKSNLFDALRLLSKLAERDLRSAMQDLRGEPLELFRQFPNGDIARQMHFAVETLLEPDARDAYGQEFNLKCTRIRYEIKIERREQSGIERLFVVEEKATPIKTAEDTWAPYGRIPSRNFKNHFMKYSVRRTPFLDTKYKDGKFIFEIHQDGGQGRVRELPANSAEATVLSSVTTAAEFKHLYALREELRSIQYLQIDPASERRPSELTAPETLLPDGSNVAAVLYRLQEETKSSDNPTGSIADILGDMSTLVPGIVDLNVVRDENRREYRLKVSIRDGQEFSSRVVSDGTLRILALLTLLHDPSGRGVICFEEPENGVHKDRLISLMRLLLQSCTHPESAGIEDESLLQMIMNTHSPVVARALQNEIVIAGTVRRIGPDGQEERCTQMRPIKLAEQGEQLDLDRMKVTPEEIEKILDISVSEAAEYVA